MQQVTLVLRGNSNDITDVIQLALAGGLLHSMTQDVKPTVNSAVQRRARMSRNWTVGQKVQVIEQNLSQYPQMPPVGTCGIVATVFKNGMASSVDVRFGKDTPGGARTTRIAGRLLKGLA